MSSAPTPGLTATALEAAIRSKLQASHVELSDVSGGCGQMFESIIVSPVFAGKTALMRHRLANTALRSEIAAVHAWSQKLYTDEEWAKRQAEAAAAAATTPTPTLE